MEYKWYELITEQVEITQGDIIFDCPVYKPLEVVVEKGTVIGEIEIIDAVVMSQACDIANGNIEDIILCSLIDVIEADIGKGKLSDIKKGAQPKYHIISKSDVDEIPMGYKIVDFLNIYSLSKNTLQSIADGKEKRIRLLPPYREHLSQAFARYFMRVGLPYDIDLKDILEEKKLTKEA